MASLASFCSGIVKKKDDSLRLTEVCVSDSRRAYEELIAPVESRMMRSVWRVVRRKDLAEDALQDALAVIWKRLDRIRCHPNPQALVLKICLNSAYDALRKRKRLLLLENRMRVLETGGSPDSDAMGALEAGEIEKEVLDAIGRLPRKQALAILMRIIQDEPFGVIAHTLGCSEITARIHVSKGRERLRQWLSHLQPVGRRRDPNE